MLYVAKRIEFICGHFIKKKWLTISQLPLNFRGRFAKLGFNFPVK